MAKTNGMNKLTAIECINLLLVNNKEQRQARSSNNRLIAMLQTFDPDTLFIVEPTRGGFELNRGSLVEAMVKIAVMHYAYGTKTITGKSDLCDIPYASKRELGLPTSIRSIEVKYATPWAKASANKTNTKYVILVTNEGIALIETANHEGNRYCWQDLDEGERLTALENLLGF